MITRRVKSMSHTQAQAFEQAHAGAIEQMAQQAVFGRQRGQQPGHLGVRQDHRQPQLAFGPAHIGQPGQILPEHVLVQEQQGRQRLLVRGRRYAPLGCEPGEEALQFGTAHFPRVSIGAMEAHEGTHPMHIGLLGTKAVVAIPDLLSQLVQQAFGGRRWRRGQSHLRIRMKQGAAVSPRQPAFSGLVVAGSSGCRSSGLQPMHYCVFIQYCSSPIV
jgi:hypothetical protein